MLKRFFLSSEFSTTIRRPVYDNTKNTSITEENNDFKDLKDLVVKQYVPIAMQMVIGIV
jgi:hypothetical protein